MLPMLEVGDRPPEFSLMDGRGKTHSLREFAGRTLVLYFYPKDDTPGCTIEACEFRDAEKEIAARGAVLAGVSKDGPAAHEKFSKKYGLNFMLLCDPELSAIKAYESWGKKKFMGREFDGVLRNTFIIGPNGRIRRIFRGVVPKGHAAKVLESI